MYMIKTWSSNIHSEVKSRMELNDAHEGRGEFVGDGAGTCNDYDWVEVISSFVCQKGMRCPYLQYAVAFSCQLLASEPCMSSGD